jgi:hypothetical protein
MIEIDLPSGAILKITLAPFSDSKALYQAILEEMKEIDFQAGSEIASLFKNISCAALSSKKIEKCLEVCFKRCTYDSGAGDLKIDAQTFEKEEHRQDYITVCSAVIEANIMPFMKSLLAEFRRFMLKLPNIPA